MSNETIIRYSILGAFALFYLVYTFRFCLVFRKDQVFTGGIKMVHYVLIWLIPFLWISLLKGLIKTTPGSHEVGDRRDPDSTDAAPYNGPTFPVD